MLPREGCRHLGIETRRDVLGGDPGPRETEQQGIDQPSGVAQDEDRRGSPVR
jgi:hypothetical protein